MKRGHFDPEDTGFTQNMDLSDDVKADEDVDQLNPHQWRQLAVLW